jgi:dihydrofolate synthase/folylpolyglutamate synthase
MVGKSRHKNLKISLAGRFQIRNAALAIATIEQVNKSAKFQLSERSIRSGLSKIQELAGLTGRLSLIQQKPPVILDVAHNPDGVTQLVAALRRLGIENPIIVFGVMKDKDHEAMVRSLEPIAVEVIAVAPQTERSRSASDVAALFTKRGLRVSAALSVSEGVRLAIQRGSQRMPILVTGSHYVVGEALQYLATKKNLTITR